MRENGRGEKLMKNAYFSPKNIGEISQIMLGQLNEIGLPQHKLTFDSGKAALLVLDMQEYFLDPNSHAFIPSAPAILPGIQNLIQAFSNHQRPIIFTRHHNEPETAGMMSIWWKNLIDLRLENSHIYRGLDTSKGTVILKQRYDAFWKTNLEELLRGEKVSQLVITGVMTNLCCETTARSAFVRDFEVFFTIDGTATYHENLHLGSIANLAHGFAMPILCKDCICQ
jgi:isochorismate hydrolase